jgi:hypothetical protein
VEREAVCYEPLVLLDKIANIFFKEAKENLRFNSLELFHTDIDRSRRLVKRRGL